MVQACHALAATTILSHMAWHDVAHYRNLSHP